MKPCERCGTTTTNIRLGGLCVHCYAVVHDRPDDAPGAFGQVTEINADLEEAERIASSYHRPAYADLIDSMEVNVDGIGEEMVRTIRNEIGYDEFVKTCYETFEAGKPRGAFNRVNGIGRAKAGRIARWYVVEERGWADPSQYGHSIHATDSPDLEGVINA
jgi:hypothetical protein